MHSPRLGALALIVTVVAGCDPNTREENPAKGFVVGGIESELTDPTTDTSITLGAGSGGTHESQPGDTFAVGIPFTAPNGNVIGAGIRFGDSGPIAVIPVPGAVGQTSGTMNIQVEVPIGICDDLSQICHDIKCYEFAVTSIGQVSAANIQSIALACNGCDEPSCQELLDSCEGTGDCGGLTCAADEICVDGTCQMQTAQNSCALRNPSCCPGQDDSCTAPDAVCFCDEFCQEADDCCADVCTVCGYCA